MVLYSPDSAIEVFKYSGCVFLSNTRFFYKQHFYK